MATRLPIRRSAASPRIHRRPVNHSTGARSTGPFTEWGGGESRAPSIESAPRGRAGWMTVPGDVLGEMEWARETSGSSPAETGNHLVASRAQAPRATSRAAGLDQSPFRWALGPPELPRPQTEVASPSV